MKIATTGTIDIYDTTNPLSLDEMTLLLYGITLAFLAL